MTTTITAAVWKPGTLGRGRLLVTVATVIAATMLGALAAMANVAGARIEAVIALVAAAFPAAVQIAAGSARLLLRIFLRRLPQVAAAPRIEPPLVVPVILRNAGDVYALRTCVDANLQHVQRRPMLFLLDGPDADAATIRGDRQLMDAVRGRLAREIARGDVAILTRRRRYDPVDRVWRGWERKRGKIEEFCRLVQGDLSTDFDGRLPESLVGMPAFVTIDVDTRLTSSTITRLAAAADRDAAIVVPVIEDVRRTRPSLLERLQAPYWMTRPFDPPTSFNQEYLGHDLFFGKGLIVVDRFLSRTRGRIADRRILSHDHLEAMLAGAVSVPGAVIREDVPSSRRHWERRQHRWMRGDLQIFPWLFASALPLSLRFHLLLVITAQLAPLGMVSGLGIALATLPTAWAGTTSVISLLLARPTLLLMPFEVLRLALDGQEPLPRRGRRIGATLSTEVASWSLAVLYAPRDAILVLHAALLVTWRLTVSGRHLLTWTDASCGTTAWAGWSRLAAAIGCVALALAVFTSVDHAIPWLLVAFWTLPPLVLDRRFGGRGDGPLSAASTSLA